ncbi:MAG: hypothetical protein AOA65_1407 [Candidatus Bathyarchaeota archaeon BA1]|nr:MAG: hypothetical protein AOA65_1407 [Candidatus Bathyarchaeota archaeon BA1]
MLHELTKLGKLTYFRINVLENIIYGGATSILVRVLCEKTL